MGQGSEIKVKVSRFNILRQDLRLRSTQVQSLIFILYYLEYKMLSLVFMRTHISKKYTQEQHFLTFKVDDRLDTCQIMCSYLCMSQIIMSKMIYKDYILILFFYSAKKIFSGKLSFHFP